MGTSAMTAEKPRYRVKARRPLTVVHIGKPQPMAADGTVIDARLRGRRCHDQVHLGRARKSLDAAGRGREPEAAAVE